MRMLVNKFVCKFCFDTAFLLRFVLILICFSSLQRAHADEVLADYVLSVGEVKTIQVGSVVRVAVGRDDLLSVNALDNGDLVLLPTQAGETDLVVWREGGRKNSYSIRVLPSNMNALKIEIDEILRSFPTLNTRISGGRVIVEGTLDPGFVDAVSNIIAELPNTISLITPVFTTREMINVKVTILEIDKTYRRDIGIRWGDTAEGPTLGLLSNFSSNRFFNDLGQGNAANAVNPDARDVFENTLTQLPLNDNFYLTFGGIASTLTSTIQLIEENGGGRILAEPVLSARSGEAATFFAGGEVPFQVIGPLGQPTIDFFDFGITLEVAPVSDGQGQILTRIVSEVSTLDTSVTVAGVPGRLTRRSESTIDVKSGETIAISGLVSTTDSTTVDQVPLLGSLPIVGNLFRSKAFQEQRTELVVLVTPKVVASNYTEIYDKELQEIRKDLDDVLGGSSILQDELAR